MEKLGYWMREIRAPFLSLSVALVFLGSAVAVTHGVFQWWRAGLALLGLVVLHISVNVLNEYSDYQSGIDFHTTPTPFSGGSGMLTAGRVAPSAAHALGILSFLTGASIGVIFLWVTNLWLLPLLAVGAFAVYSYTDFLARRALGEVFAGLGLGFLPVMGAAFVQTGSYSLTAFAVAVPAGILTFNLLLINEFPDYHADVQGGRKNLLMVLGKSGGGRLYTTLLAVMYVWILMAVVLDVLPAYCLGALLTIVVSWKPMQWALSESRDKEQMVPALGANVLTNLATQTLLGIGLLASLYLG